MKGKIKLLLHPVKVWDYIFPVYAKEYFEMDFFEFTGTVLEKFDLTEEQIDAIRVQFVYKAVMTGDLE